MELDLRAARPPRLFSFIVQVIGYRLSSAPKAIKYRERWYIFQETSPARVSERKYSPMRLSVLRLRVFRAANTATPIRLKRRGIVEIAGNWRTFEVHHWQHSAG